MVFDLGDVNNLSDGKVALGLVIVNQFEYCHEFIELTIGVVFRWLTQPARMNKRLLFSV